MIVSPVKSLLRFLGDVDAYCNREREVLYYLILSLFLTTQILFTFPQVYGTPSGTDFIEGSAILSSLTSPGYWDGKSMLGGYSPREFVVMTGSIYLCQGISFLWVFLFEIGNGGALGLRKPDERIDLVGRTLSHIAFVLPALAFLSLTNDLTRLAVLIQATYSMQLFPVIGSICMITCSQPTEGTDNPWFARPSVGAFLVAFLGMSILANQVYLCGLTSANHLSDWAQAAMYMIGVVCLSAVAWYCYKIVTLGTIVGRGYDIIVLVVVGTVWILSFRSTRATSTLSVTTRDAQFNIDNWFRFRFAGGCVFLLSWQLRSTLVFLKRVESEKKKEAAIRAEVLHRERQVALQLLHAMVPPRIATELCRGVVVVPELHPFSTVFFSDIVGFTRFSSIKTPLEVFAMLNRLFRVMDYCVSLFPKHLYKVEAVGDAFMVVGGLPPAAGDGGSAAAAASYEDEARWRQDVTLATCQFALLIREAVQMVPLDEVSFVKIRIGIHTGSIVTGLNGSIVPRFSCFGDTANVASRSKSCSLVLLRGYRSASASPAPCIFNHLLITAPLPPPPLPRLLTQWSPRARLIECTSAGPLPTS